MSGISSFSSIKYEEADKHFNTAIETNEDGSPMLDEDGNQIVTKGLKSQKKQIIKNQASG